MSTPHPFEGTWLPIKAELDGEAAPELALAQMEMRFHQGNYAVSYAQEVFDEGSYLLDTSAEPGTLTLNGTKGTNADRTLPAIFQLKGDRLRVCFGVDGLRPTEFSTSANARRYLVFYRRKTPQT